jgi:hypothetical protein
MQINSPESSFVFVLAMARASGLALSHLTSAGEHALSLVDNLIGLLRHHSRGSQCGPPAGAECRTRTEVDDGRWAEMRGSGGHNSSTARSDSPDDSTARHDQLPVACCVLACGTLGPSIGRKQVLAAGEGVDVYSRATPA